MRSRIQALKDSFEKKKLDGYIVADESNILYFTGAIGAVGLWVPLEGENVLYVYGVNYESVKTTAKNCQVELLKHNEDPFKKIVTNARPLKLKHIGFDDLNVVYYLRMRKTLKEARLRPLNKLVKELRMVKDPTEVHAIRKAAELTEAGLEAAINATEPGVREYEVAAQIEYAMRKLGSEGVAFDTQVASGARSAFPHGGCTDRKIRKGEFIVLDLGAKYNNYRSDVSRTFIIGRPSPKQKRIYDVVLEAQRESFETIRAGVKARDVDAAARKIVEDFGFGKYFVHGLGHGVGLDIHEAPSLNPEGKETLKTGNVVTDEPGIYIVDYGGVRIEDTVLVHENNAERLTKAAFEFVIR